MLRLVHGALLVSVASCAKPLPPLGEALFEVDTDLPASIASALRVDVYSNEGVWLESRDELTADRFPLSFSVAQLTEGERVAWVRLRTYPKGRLVRYRGAIDAPYTELLRQIPVADELPRLFREGADRTPEWEPDPVVTVDRVVEVRLRTGERHRMVVLLAGECVGEVAVVPPRGAFASCVKERGRRESTAPERKEWSAVGARSHAGTFGDVPCAAEASSDSRVCVPGGVFLLGDPNYRQGGEAGEEADPRPERVVRVPRLFFDRDEVRVAQFRRAKAEGFVPPKEPLRRGAEGDPASECPYSERDEGREGAAIACVPWDTADAMCNFLGGRLPTEAEWEYAAASAGRGRKSLYVWGDEPPDCSRAVFGRWLSGECPSDGPAGHNDHPLGIENMAGGVAEFVADNWASYRDPCFRSDRNPLSPVCKKTKGPPCPFPFGCPPDPAQVHTARGGSWASPSSELRTVFRERANVSPRIGFRCVHDAP